MDKPSWDECLKTHRKYADWLSNRLYPQRDAARRSEVKQAALIGLYDAWTRWDPSISKLTTYSYWYIRKAVTEQVSEYMQDYGCEDVSTYADDLPADASLEGTQGLFADLLTDAVFSTMERQILTLVYLDDMTQADAAQRLHLTRQRIQQIHAVALDKLQRLAQK